MLTKVLTSSTWLIAERVLKLTLSVLVGTQVARALGPSQFGQYSYAISLLAIAMCWVNLGADTIVVRTLAQAKVDEGVVIGSMLLVRLLAGVLSAIGIMWYALYLGGSASEKAVIIVLCVLLISQALDISDLWFQAHVDSPMAVRCRMVGLLIGSMCKTACILFHASLAFYAIAQVIETGLSSVFVFIVFRRKAPAMMLNVDRGVITDIVRESTPYLISGVAIMLYMRVDQMLIRHYCDAATLGIYNASASLSQVWYTVPAAAITSIAPYVARARTQSKAEYEWVMGWVLNGAFLSGVALCAGCSVFGGPFVRFFMGPAYIPAVAVLRVHIWANVFIFTGLAQSLWIVNEGRGRLALGKSVAGFILNSALNVFLIPRYGAMGAAIAAVATQFGVNFVVNAIVAPEVLKLQFLGVTGIFDRPSTGT